MLITVIKEGVECWEVGIFSRLKKNKIDTERQIAYRSQKFPAIITLAIAFSPILPVSHEL